SRGFAIEGGWRPVLRTGKSTVRAGPPQPGIAGKPACYPPGPYTEKNPGERLMKLKGLHLSTVAAFVFAIVAGPAAAQGRGGSIPVAPLPDSPWEYQTASANIRVSVLTAGLENPWSLEFLP